MEKTQMLRRGELFVPNLPDFIVEVIRSSGIFVFNSRGIFYSSQISPDSEPFYESFHSPLATLWFLFKGITTYVNSAAELTNKTEKNPYPNRWLPRKALVEMHGFPGEIIDILSQDEAALKSGVFNLIARTIGRAKKIMLAGCLNIFSALHLAWRLSSLGFTGRLDIYDISQVPLTMIESSKKTGIWEDMGIEIKTFRRDLRVYNPLEGDPAGYDVIISDVLGYYLDDETLQRCFFSICWNALDKNGIVLLRDMEDLQSLQRNPPLYKTMEKPEEDEENFQRWLAQNFDTHIPIEEIRKMRNSLFSKPPPRTNGPRFNLVDQLDYLFTAPDGLPRMDLLYKGLFAPSTDPTRNFWQLVFLKSNFEPPSSYLTNPNGFSMARVIG